MPYKDLDVKKAKHKGYAAKHYQANKDQVQKSARDTRRKGRALWAEYKATLTCTTCGFSHPAVIDFHHPPGTKKYGVNTLIKDGRYALADKEAAKCIVLCANCHRIHHYKEKGDR